MKEITSKYPEVKSLFGYTRLTAVYALLIIAFQFVIAYFLKDQSLWLIFLSAYLLGSFANHALFVVIHECTHNLVFKSTLANRWMGMIANFPQFFPSAMGFSKYHTLHHSNQSEYDFDPDLAGPKEAAWVSNSALRKTIFLIFFGLIQGLFRPARIKKVPFLDRWIILNFLVQFLFLGITFYFWGYKPLLYFFLSTFFGLGLHPLGARWIQEHYVVKEGQETYSYYGPLNKLCFNMGYHNEHHDFAKVPWSKLPQLKKIAPEYYDTLYAHSSWTQLLWRFIFDKNLSLYSRIVRPSKVTF